MMNRCPEWLGSVKADIVGIVFLVGSRGCGKSLVSRILEREYGCRVYNTDAMIREKTGKTVAEIVAEGGWPLFRTIEKDVLGKAIEAACRVEDTRVVIATGGGMVLDPENRERMRATGGVTYLSAPADVLAGRLDAPENDPSRPPLTKLPQEMEIVAVLKEREPLYRSAAHYVVDATQDARIVARLIHEHFTKPSGRNSGTVSGSA